MSVPSALMNEPSHARQDDSGKLSVLVVDPGSFSLGYDYCLCNALVRAGCEVTLANSEFLYCDWKYPSLFSTWSGFYRRTHALARHCSRGVLWKIAKAAEHVIDMAKLVAAARRMRPDVIHFQWLPLPLVDNRYLAVLKRLSPLLLTVHNTDSSLARAGGFALQKKGFQSSLRHFSAAIVHSEYGKDRVIRQKWFSSDQVEFVPMGAYDHYDHIGEPYRARFSAEHVIVFVGSIKPYKGVDVLVQALARLPKDLLNSTRLIVMGTPDKHIAALRKLACDADVDRRITWKLGFVSEEELATEMRQADVVVLPYREADQSSALFTAVGMGKPIIASRVGGIPEVIQDGTHGHLVEPGEAEKLADAIAHLLSDPVTRDRMADAVRRLRTQFTWDRTAARTYQLYSRISGRGPEHIRDASIRTAVQQ